MPLFALRVAQVTRLWSEVRSDTVSQLIQSVRFRTSISFVPSASIPVRSSDDLTMSSPVQEVSNARPASQSSPSSPFVPGIEGDRTVVEETYVCRGQVVSAAERHYTAVAVGASTSDVLLLLKTGL